MSRSRILISGTSALVALLIVSPVFAAQMSVHTTNRVTSAIPDDLAGEEKNDPYVVGDLSILSELIKGAESHCQRVAVVGDSQETHPAGAGRELFSRLIVNAFDTFGPASETELCFSGNVSNRGMIVTSDGTDFQTSVTSGYTILPGTRIRAQSATPYGFCSVLAPRAQGTGINRPSATLDDLQDWFTYTDLRAEYIFMGNAAGPDHMKIQFRPTNTAAPDWSRPLEHEETIDHSLSIIGDGVFVKYRTPNLPDSTNPDYVYPQVILRSTDSGGTIALGGRCAGMRWVDHARNQGAVFQSFGSGGATTTSWLSSFGDAHPQFQAYGPWSQIWIAFGANDADSKDKATYKAGLQALIDRFRDGDWQQDDVPIVLLTDFARQVAGNFSAANAETLRTEYWEAIQELCDENENVAGINSFGLMENAGYDPDNAEHSADGVHLTAQWNWKRADLIWQAMLDAASITMVVNPNTVELVSGEFSKGGVEQLVDSDDVDMVIVGERGNYRRAIFEVEGSSPIAAPTRFDFTLEASAFSRTSPTQSISLYDYETDKYEVLDSRPSQRLGDLTVVVQPIGDLSRFVEPHTGFIRARIEFVSPSLRVSSKTDQIKWSIE